LTSVLVFFSSVLICLSIRLLRDEAGLPELPQFPMKNGQPDQMDRRRANVEDTLLNNDSKEQVKVKEANEQKESKKKINLIIFIYFKY
jgi:hypothetical protein